MTLRMMRSERGTSLIEFAVVLPVLCFLLIGMIDLGRAMYYGIVASNAARAGAQYGAQYLWTVNDSSGIKSAVAQDSPGTTWTVTTQAACSINGSAIIPCPPVGTVQANTTYYVKVHVSGSVPLLVNYPGLPAAIPISAENITRVVTQ